MKESKYQRSHRWVKEQNKEAVPYIVFGIIFTVLGCVLQPITGGASILAWGGGLLIGLSILFIQQPDECTKNGLHGQKTIYVHRNKKHKFFCKECGRRLKVKIIDDKSNLPQIYVTAESHKSGEIITQEELELAL